MNLLNRFYYRADGRSCARYARELKLSAGIDRREQGLLLADHLKFCRDTVPMYRALDVSTKDPFDTLRQVPVFDKTRLSANCPMAISSQAAKGCRVDSTSGTSGQTFRFIVGRNELGVRKVYETVANEMLGLAPGARHLQIWGGHESGSVSKRAKNAAYSLLTGRTLRTVSGSDRRSLSRCAGDIRRHAGGCLITYPSILYGLCRLEAMAEHLQTYRSIILTGEAVDYRLFAQFGLGDNLRNRYGSREFGVIALADRGAMRYFQSRYVLECNRPHGLLVTDLAKKAMPMLRYPIGDFVDPSFERANSADQLAKLAHLGRVEGRTFDTIEGRSGKRYVGTFWTLTMRQRIAVDKFRLVLRPNYCLEVNYVGGPGEDEVRNKLLSILAGDFDLTICRRDQISELSNAKQKIVTVET